MTCCTARKEPSKCLLREEEGDILRYGGLDYYYFLQLLGRWSLQVKEGSENGEIGFYGQYSSGPGGNHA